MERFNGVRKIGTMYTAQIFNQGKYTLLCESTQENEAERVYDEAYAKIKQGYVIK